MILIRNFTIIVIALWLTLISIGCDGEYSTYSSTQGTQTSLDGQRNSPHPEHLERQPGEIRSHLKVRVQFIQQAVGNRGDNNLFLFLNDERVQKTGWVKEFNFLGTPYDILYYDETVRAGQYTIKFHDIWGEPSTTTYDFNLEQGKWYTLYITIKNNKHFYRLEQEY